MQVREAILQRWNAITSALVAFITGGSVATHCGARLTSSPTRRATFANAVWLVPNALSPACADCLSVCTDVSVSGANASCEAAPTPYVLSASPARALARDG